MKNKKQKLDGDAVAWTLFMLLIVIAFTYMGVYPLVSQPLTFDIVAWSTVCAMVDGCMIWLIVLTIKDYWYE